MTVRTRHQCWQIPSSRRRTLSSHRVMLSEGALEASDSRAKYLVVVRDHRPAASWITAVIHALYHAPPAPRVRRAKATVDESSSERCGPGRIIRLMVPLAGNNECGEIIRTTNKFRSAAIRLPLVSLDRDTLCLYARRGDPGPRSKIFGERPSVPRWPTSTWKSPSKSYAADVGSDKCQRMVSHRHLDQKWLAQ